MDVTAESLQSPHNQGVPLLLFAVCVAGIWSMTQNLYAWYYLAAASC